MDTASEGEADKWDEDESGGVTTEKRVKMRERWQRMKRIGTEAVNFRKSSRERLRRFGLAALSQAQQGDGSCRRR